MNFLLIILKLKDKPNAKTVLNINNYLTLVDVRKLVIVP
jgi:hypothetical protein